MANRGDEEQYLRALDLVATISELLNEIASQEEIRNHKLAKMLLGSVRFSMQELAATIRAFPSKLKSDHPEIPWGSFELTETMSLWREPQLNSTVLLHRFDATLMAIQKLLLSEMLASSLEDFN